MPPYKAVPNRDENVLRKHVEFFDRNNDGIVYPWETYQGLRAIGVGIPLSIFLAIFINVTLSSATRPGKRFSILFPLEVANVQLGKHGSDTGAFDAKGRFVPWAFEEIFAKHAHTDPDYLTSDELQELLKANRDPKDVRGWIGAWIEWKLLYRVAKDSNGVLRKETLRKLYDGTLFAELEKQRAYK